MLIELKCIEKDNFLKSTFGKRVYIPDVVEHFRGEFKSYKKAREKTIQVILKEKKSLDFLGFERTSEMFISKYKIGSWRDKKAKRAFVLIDDFWISHINFK